MKEFIFAQELRNHAPIKIIEDVFRLRHDIFIERLAWDIPSEKGMERDRFDDLNPYHIALRSAGGEISGCWRALPTTGDYMLASVFPELLQGETAPRHQDVWEISRFAMRKDCSSQKQGYMSSLTFDMVRSFYDFAQKAGIKRYVAVTTVACERMLKVLGVDVCRMGEGKVIKVGKERSVALWIDVNERLRTIAH